MISSKTARVGKARARAEAAEAAERRQREWLSTTLSSIGDAVITTDAQGNVGFLNPVAEALTGSTQDEAAGRSLSEVIRTFNEKSRETVEDPVNKVIRDGAALGLANHALLIARDGTERPIDDSAAPIREQRGGIAGVVLVFRDLTDRRHRANS
jgi:PAS domain S-box-containing protein